MSEAIAIVGAGECGTRAAFTLREEGWDGRLLRLESWRAAQAHGVGLKSVLRSPVAG